MHIRFALDAIDCRRWLLQLAREMNEAGHAVSFDVRQDDKALRSSVDKALSFERRLYTIDGRSAFTPLAPAKLGHASGVPDIRIDLSRDARNALVLIVNGQAGMSALPNALMTGRPVALALRAPDGALVAQGVPALSDPLSLWRSLSDVTARLATLCLMALSGHPAPCAPPPLPAGAPAPSLPVFLARALARKLAARVWPTRFRREHWRVGVRRHNGAHAGMPGGPLEGVVWVEDDGGRYFADPFLLEHEGRTFLYVEEYLYAEHRGVIACTELKADGSVTAMPRTIIRREGHLSFPQVFSFAGQHYMFAENSADGCVPLFRARHLPDDWEELPPLLDHPLHDPVLFVFGGRYWIIGTLALGGGSSCDALAAYSSPSPLGPFEPHKGNPLLLDARFARAGGAILSVEGRPVRVSQDCCAGYGTHLRFAEIAQLGEEGVTLTPLGEWHAPRGRGMAGMHSYARSAQFEAIDVLMARGVKP